MPCADRLMRAMGGTEMTDARGTPVTSVDCLGAHREREPRDLVERRQRHGPFSPARAWNERAATSPATFDIA